MTPPHQRNLRQQRADDGSIRIGRLTGVDLPDQDCEREDVRSGGASGVVFVELRREVEKPAVKIIRMFPEIYLVFES